MADCAIFVLWDAVRGLALMEDRPDLKPDADHYWVYPGGKVEDGETAEYAMVRECIEEIGIAPMSWMLLTAHNLISHPEPGTVQYTKAPEGWRVIPFLVTRWSGTVPTHTQEENHAVLKWVDPRTFAGDAEADPFTRNVAIANLLVEIQS